MKNTHWIIVTLFIVALGMLGGSFLLSKNRTQQDVQQNVTQEDFDEEDIEDKKEEDIEDKKEKDNKKDSVDTSQYEDMLDVTEQEQDETEGSQEHSHEGNLNEEESENKNQNDEPIELPFVPYT